MEFKGQLIRNLLRILTPEEIADLTTSSSGMKKVSLSLVLESDLIGKNYRDVIQELQEEEEPEDDGKAKILPFDEEVENEIKPISIQAGQRVHALIQEYNKVFKELDKKVLGPKRFPKRSSSGNRKQTSVLILEQKAKLHSSYAKIKSKEVMSLYQQSSNTEVRKSSEDEKDFSISSNQGLLINKKQA
ncbi:MAG: hypothetical protein NXH75_15620 [Halobacteriovoraceae bacterium]|nr:hypothetical protein [Halobacteriovoraceae bacterium]